MTDSDRDRLADAIVRFVALGTDEPLTVFVDPMTDAVAFVSGKPTSSPPDIPQQLGMRKVGVYDRRSQVSAIRADLAQYGHRSQAVAA